MSMSEDDDQQIMADQSAAVVDAAEDSNHQAPGNSHGDSKHK